LDRYDRAGLNSAINLAVGRGDGAWELAQAVEQYLQPGRDCPRWARERLRDLTAVTDLPEESLNASFGYVRSSMTVSL